MVCVWLSDEGSNQAAHVLKAGWWLPSFLGIRGLWLGFVQLFKGHGADLANCFVEFENENLAKNSEMAQQRHLIPCSNKITFRQSAGIATAVVMEGYPHTRFPNQSDRC